MSTVLIMLSVVVLGLYPGSAYTADEEPDSNADSGTLQGEQSDPDSVQEDTEQSDPDSLEDEDKVEKSDSDEEASDPDSVQEESDPDSLEDEDNVEESDSDEETMEQSDSDSVQEQSDPDSLEDEDNVEESDSDEEEREHSDPDSVQEEDSMSKGNRSSLSTFDALAARVPGDELSGVHHNIHLKDFQIGCEVNFRIKKAPSSGRIIFSLIDDTKRRIVLNVGIRYKWYSSKHVLVLNGWKGGKWGPEQRPSGFDFTPGKSSLVTIKAESIGFCILQNGKMIALFSYWSGLPVTSVRRIRALSSGNKAAKDISVSVKFV